MYHIKKWLKKALDYYYANKEVIMEKDRNRYRALLPEEKKKRYESNRQWYNRQWPEEKKQEWNKSKKNIVKTDIIDWW